MTLPCQISVEDCFAFDFEFEFLEASDVERVIASMCDSDVPTSEDLFTMKDMESKPTDIDSDPEYDDKSYFIGWELTSETSQSTFSPTDSNGYFTDCWNENYSDFYCNNTSTDLILSLQNPTSTVSSLHSWKMRQQSSTPRIIMHLK